MTSVSTKSQLETRSGAHALNFSPWEAEAGTSAFQVGKQTVTREMDQRVKVLAAKHGNLSLIWQST